MQFSMHRNSWTQRATHEVTDHLLWLILNNPLAMQETWVGSLGWEDPLEKGKATHSSIMA